MSKKKWWEALIDADFTIHWAEEKECRINSTSLLRIIDYRAYQELKAENRQLKAQAEKLAATLGTIASHYGQRPDDRELARVYEDLANDTLTFYNQWKKESEG